MFENFHPLHHTALVVQPFEVKLYIQCTLVKGMEWSGRLNHNHCCKDSQVKMPLASEFFMEMSCISAQDMLQHNYEHLQHQCKVYMLKETTTRQLSACLYGSRCEEAVDSR